MSQKASVDTEKAFGKMGGFFTETYMPVMNSPVHTTKNGTPYLKKPGVVMISRPSTDLSGMEGFLDGFDSSLGFSEYLDDSTEAVRDSTLLCKAAGQLCYMSFGPRRTTNERARRYFDNIISSGHGSVLEHANFSFLLYGISRSVTHELVRHRPGIGFSQVSQRYVDGTRLRFVERPEFQGDHELHVIFEHRIDNAAVGYESTAGMLLEKQEDGDAALKSNHSTDLRKKVNQAARALLPNETEAPIVVTANVRAWRHILAMRGSAHAETEIRRLAVSLLLCLKIESPILFEDYTLHRSSDGGFEIATPSPKV